MEQSRAVAALALTMCPWEQSQEGEGKVHLPVQIMYLSLPIAIFSACGEYIKKLNHHYHTPRS
jgi:hypothetical protein